MDGDSYVVAHGNAFGGISLVGPFDTSDEAHEYVNRNPVAIGQWEIVPVMKPEPDLDRYQRQWVDTSVDRVLTFDECERLGLDGTHR